MPRTRPDAGFSFIELLAYMAIAALLILAAIPQFNNYRGNARDQTTLNDARNVAVAMNAWTIAHPGEVFPQIASGWRTPDNQLDVFANLGVSLSKGTRLYAVDRARQLGTTDPLGLEFCLYLTNTDGRKYFGYDSGERFAYSSIRGMGVECGRD